MLLIAPSTEHRDSQPAFVYVHAARKLARGQTTLQYDHELREYASMGTVLRFFVIVISSPLHRLCRKVASGSASMIIEDSARQMGDANTPDDKAPKETKTSRRAPPGPRGDR